MQNIIRIILFIVFFGLGATSLSVSILCDDLIQYYQNKQLLEKAQKSLDQLKSLNYDYDMLLSELEKDPNLVKRIAPVTLGIEPEDPNAIYPKVSPSQLAAAKKALTEEEPNQPAIYTMVPELLMRCCKWHRRMALFLAGSALILTSFVCFVPTRKQQKKS